MKIAIVAPTYLPARRANTFQVMKMAQGLVAGNHTVRVAVPAADVHFQRPEWEQLAHHYGLQEWFSVEWLCAHPRLRRHDFGWRSIFWARDWQADLVYTRLPQSAALASLLGMTTILEVHDLPQGRIGPVMFRLFLRGKGASRLVVISQALLEDLEAKFGLLEKDRFAMVAPDGIDLRRYENIPSPQQARLELNRTADFGLSLPVDRFTLGYTGHLYPGRGVELLIELAERLPNTTILLVGGEPTDVLNLREMAISKGLDNVVLTGFVENRDLPRFQASCDILLMPYQTRVEASSGGDISRYLSPMKMFEYLACGRVILSSNLPVLREVLTKDTAVLLPPEDVDAWEKAVEEMRNDPDRRNAMAANARRNARNYSWEERAIKILEGIH